MTSLVRLRKDAIRARRRPRVVMLLWLWEATLGVLLGSTFASVATTAYGHHPDGDAPLFAPGGLPLLDLARHSLAARGPLLAATLLTVAFARFVGILPAAAVFADILFTTSRKRAPPLRHVLLRGLVALPASLSIAVVTLALQGAAVAFGLIVAATLSSSAVARLGARDGDLVVLAIAALGVAGAVVVGVTGDIARASVVRHEAPAFIAIPQGMRSFARHPMALTWSYLWREASSWVPVIVVAMVATELGGRGGLALVVLAGLHQAVIVTRASIKASWMSRVLRALD